MSGGVEPRTSLRDWGKASRTSGDLSLTSTSWANVDTGLDIVLDAVAGDEIEVGLSGFTAAHASVTTQFDVVSVVGGTPVNAVSSGATESGTGAGIQAWYAPSQAATTLHVSMGGSVMYTLQTGDIESGTVTLRLRYRNGSAGTRVISANSNNRFQWWAKNFGSIS